MINPKVKTPVAPATTPRKADSCRFQSRRLDFSDTGGEHPGMRLCRYCREKPVLRSTQVYCSRKCRQAAFRLRRLRQLPATAVVSVGAARHEPGRFAYADPPYLGLSKRYYRDHPDYQGEVDHRALIASLAAASYTGWALSCSRDSLRVLLPMCPEGTLVCPWVKCIGVSGKTYGPHNAWEAVLVFGGRKLQPGVRDWLRAQPARKWGTLMGRKPIAFCAWLFDLLGMLPGDELVDVFPGTGGVARAWRELSSPPGATAVAVGRRPATEAGVAARAATTLGPLFA